MPRPALAGATLGARDAIALVATDFAAFDYPAKDRQSAASRQDDGPLGWPGYAQTRARARAASGEDESVLCGVGRIGAQPVVLISFNFRHIGGSIGSQAGARICHAFAEARRLRYLVISLLATGGSRVQEGMWSLRQLQRIAAEAHLTRAAGIAHIAVLRHPTTGGVWASLGAGADIVVGLRGASVAFAGRRLRPGGGPESDAFRAEGKFRTGQVDLLALGEGELASVLDTLVDLLAAPPLPDPAPVPRALGSPDLPADGWEAVRRARHADRPRAAAYLDDYFDVRVPLRGDRCGGVDSGMLCGLGRHLGRSMAYAAQTGTPNTPAGYRTAARVISLADRLGLPVLTLVDTPGAANGEPAESAGVGPALSELFATIAGARVPITTLVIGEGGSGGALALASPDRLWITPDGYFSVISPESAAAILKRNPRNVRQLSDRLRLRPQDLLADGVLQGIASPDTTTWPAGTADEPPRPLDQ